MICDFDLLGNWLRLYKKHFFLMQGDAELTIDEGRLTEDD
jgi:hypothetical protein